VPVSKALISQVDAYGVAMIEEALELRDAGIDKMILILGYTGEEWYEELVKHCISQTIYTYDMAKKLSDVAVSHGKQTPIHIKIDTGMGRIGFAPTEESVGIVEKISQLPGVFIEGIFTHFARADEKTIEAAKEPFARYMQFVQELEKKGIRIPVRHVSNSASIISFPEANLDMVRSGITTYGLYPSEDVPKEILKLQPAMSWKSKISYVKPIEPGTSVSYGGTFTAEKPMIVATVPVGYADGMKRDLSGKGRVLVHGQYARILGRVCMDQFMIDVTDISNVKMGDTVTIFGKDGDKCIPVEEIAEMSHSFNYEFVCSISNRVPRKYIGN
ncbi:MAG: alanine racemase, partial [Eubacterium sp.]|nr:alanine racemase [Eubacterium sp.]